MYELYLSDGHYIQGRKIGKSSEDIKTLKERAAKELGSGELFFEDALDSDAECIWIDQGELRSPVGLIKPVKSTRAEPEKD